LMEGVPVWVQVAVALAAVFGVKEFGLAVFNWATGRQKAVPEVRKLQGEVDAMHLTNEQARLDHIDRMTDRVKELLAQSETQAEVNAQLKSDLGAERLRVARREGVIEYQKEEIRELHESIAQIREEMAVISSKMETLTRAHDEMTTLTMRQTAVLEKLKAEGKWDGFENGTTG
jgi:chromosome segregation ATPase